MLTQDRRAHPASARPNRSRALSGDLPPRSKQVDARASLFLIVLFVLLYLLYYIT